jgi:signal transduction histidine kinase
MDMQYETKEEILSKLQELQQENNSLKVFKEKLDTALAVATKKIAYQQEEKGKFASELGIANIEIDFHEEEKEKRAAELIIANKELIFQNEEKEKRAAELIIANKELIFQNKEKEKRAAELIIANKELIFQNEEKEKRAAELIIAKERAEESDRLKSAFLANMSHEIRTPMNGILGFADLLKEPGLTGETQQKYIRIIEKGGDRMLNIINDIISISKIESGLMKVNLQESNVNKQIEFIDIFFKPQVAAKKLRF